MELEDSAVMKVMQRKYEEEMKRRKEERERGGREREEID